jgi:RHS repeat-associated protein
VERALRSRDLSANQADAYGYASAGGARPNAVSQVRLANGSLRRYGYDASGNLVCQTDDGQSGSCDQWPQFEAYYNHNQQPSYQRRKASGSGANAQYAESWYSYGADQQPARQWGIERIEGCTLDSLGCLRHHRIYLDRYEDSVGTLRHIDGRARQARTRAYIGDYLVATRGDAGQLELSYLLRDRLGSVVGVEQVTLSDRRISGLTPETRHAFDAFGAPRSNRWWSANRWHDIGTWYSPTRTQQGFTGHERLSGLQLIHMRGRVFDPVLGRFHGVDPIIQFPLSSQGLNPYSYLLNNPMAGVDPTGYCSEATVEGEKVTCKVTPTGSRIAQRVEGTIGSDGHVSFYGSHTVGGKILVGANTLLSMKFETNGAATSSQTDRASDSLTHSDRILSVSERKNGSSHYSTVSERTTTQTPEDLGVMWDEAGLTPEQADLLRRGPSMSGQAESVYIAEELIAGGYATRAGVQFGKWGLGWLQSLRAPQATTGIKPFALGISEHLEGFAAARGAETWKNLPDPMKWKSGVLDALSDPRRQVHFNLDGVDVWRGVQRAASGRGGATDWELLQVKQSPQFWDTLHFWKSGREVPNPFN